MSHLPVTVTSRKEIISVRSVRMKRREKRMKRSVIVFTAPGKAELQESDWAIPELRPDEVLLETECTLISPGTERACLLGLAGGDFPKVLGYSAVARVLDAGKESGFHPGERVAVYHSSHASLLVKRACDLVRVEEETLSSHAALFCIVGAMGLQGVRKAMPEFGESMAVMGLGLLGLLAVQIAACSGALPLLVSDYDPARRKLALELGADAAFDPADPDFIGQVRSASGGKGVDAVVEVTGVAAALKQALKYVAGEGRISLLGCTRVPDAVIDFYQDVHLPGVTLIGAHTRNRPRVESRPGQWTEHDDYRTFLRLLAHGKLRVRPLISEIVSPEQAHEVYNTILEQKNPPPGFVFDWNLLP